MSTSQRQIPVGKIAIGVGTILFFLLAQFRLFRHNGMFNFVDMKTAVDNTAIEVTTDLRNDAIPKTPNETIEIYSDTTKDQENALAVDTSITVTDETNKVSDSITTDTNDEVPVTTSTSNSTIASNNFTRYDGVVITTKILWPKDISILERWICLISHAYNDKMQYDIVVFTTLPWEENDIARLQNVAAPANLFVVLEGPPLEEQLAAMSKEEVKFLRNRCGRNDTDDRELSWFNHCTEPHYRHKANLGYSWQAEFRSYHIWTHPVMMKYKYMMWFDSDCKATKDFPVDPMKTMIEKDLTVLFVGWPYGTTGNDATLRSKMIHHYNTSICGAKKDTNQEGLHLYGNMDQSCVNFGQVAGNHHITNLEVFRKDVHQQFLKNFTGDYRFCRRYDDQMAVTIIGLMEQYIANNYTSGIPKKYTILHERSEGIQLDISHHGLYDVKTKGPVAWNGIWKKHKANWTGVEERCGSYF